VAVIASPERVKPRLRGVFHELGFYVALGLGSALVVTADAGRPRFAAAEFSACVILCFGASALYHRPTWTPQVRAWLARLDHAGVYLLIAGSYTPFGLLVMSKGWAVPVLTIVWAGALAAIMLKFFWVRSPKWLSAAIGLALGWVAVAAFSQLLRLPVAGLLLVTAGGLFYTAGAIVYVRRRPDPVPNVLGYHELFHVATLVGTGCMYASIAFFVLPRG
jgi:hemolysin III